ncbi:Unannotated [Lentimonas sp. CC4]|nr:Unannotated [Lentimonas sp. CC4]
MGCVSLVASANMRGMKELEKACDDADLQKKASRAQSIITILMLLFMVLPFVAAWLTGALRF